ALSAALTGLPTVPSDTTLACGVGTGTHGGDFAFSGGCASKVNESLSVNYAASIIMPGQDYAGDFEDKFSARAGFVWKLGKPVKPTLISMKEKKEFETQINTLEETNKQLLEKLEKVALGSIQSKDLASNKINFKSVNRDLKKIDFK
ncbi:MAG: YadA C-terminal domain-containing protein, partial [Prochlorococcus marinus XMU1426]|nr:YadA C-terminal domain-containing protein [Prochlorococcus marinus XMU1426]